MCILWLTLGLEIFLHGLKPDISQTSGDQTLKEPRALDADVILLSQSTEDVLRKAPDDRHDGIEQSQDKETSLQEDAQIVLVRRPGKGARGQRVQGGSTSQPDQPRRRHGEHVRERRRGQGLGGQPAHDQDRDGLERVLERVGQDDRHGRLAQQPYLGEPYPPLRDAGLGGRLGEAT